MPGTGALARSKDFVDIVGVMVGPNDGSGTSSSYLRNVGKISSHWLEIGSYGMYLNSERLRAYRLALMREKHSLAEVVDVGCSTGSWESNWRELGASRVIGVDPNPDALQVAAKVFDLAVLGDTRVLPLIGPRTTGRSRTFASNGVLVHVLEDDEVLSFAEDLHSQMRSGEKLFIAVLDSAHYLSPEGFVPWKGPLSCTRTLSHSIELLTTPGFHLKQVVGTFINPWFSDSTKWIASSSRAKNFAPMWNSLRIIATILRLAKSRALFGEYLLVFERS